MRVFNEDTRVKIPATLQFLRIGYKYQSLKDSDIDFNTKVFINRFKPAIEKLNDRRSEICRLVIKSLCLDAPEVGKALFQENFTRKQICL